MSSPVTQKTALPLANCSTHELQLNRTHGHQWSCVRCEEHRAWPTTTSVEAAGNQHCSPVGARRWGNAAPCCADIGKQELPNGRWYARALAANAVPWATVTCGKRQHIRGASRRCSIQIHITLLFKLNLSDFVVFWLKGLLLSTARCRSTHSLLSEFWYRSVSRQWCSQRLLDSSLPLKWVNSPSFNCYIGTCMT